MPPLTSTAIKRRVLLVDDHFIVRMGLSASLNEEPDLEIIGEASTISEAIEILGVKHPDIALIDMCLPDGSGSDLIRTISERFPATRCMVLSVNLGEIDIQ